MRYERRVGIVLFAALIAIAVSSSFYITSFTISDSDPSTYVVVPLLMLPLFALFMLKERIGIDVKGKDLAIGLLAFLLLIVLTVYSRFVLSYLFLSYRVDMLLFPMLVVSLASLLFGARSLRKFTAIAIYALLASSLLMFPFIAGNQNFAVFNTVLIYNAAKGFIHGLSYLPPITIAANGHQIGIGQACVGVGILIAVVLFLLPVAYLYEGSIKSKVLWVFSGFALLLVLNVLRMLSIATLWLAYGPNNALLEVHLFAGVLLFYISIMAMILIAGRYGLKIASGKTKTTKKSTQRPRGYYKAGIVLAILAALGYFALTSNYSSSLYISQVYFSGSPMPQISTQGADQMAGSLINATGLYSSIATNDNSSVAMLLWGKNISEKDPLVVYILYPNQSAAPGLVPKDGLVGSMYFLNGMGISGTVYDVESNNTEFLVYRTGLPYAFSGQNGASMLSIYMVVPASQVNRLGCSRGYNAFYTYLLNILNPAFYNQQLNARMFGGYCLFNGVLR